MTDGISWDDLINEAGDNIQTSFEALPAGDYDLEIVEATATQSKAGKPMFKTKSKVVGGPYNGRLLWDNIVLTTDNAQALGFFFRKMGALGLTVDYFKQKPSNAHITASLQGRKYRAKIGQRTYNGELQNEFKTYYQVPTAPGAVAGGAPAPAAAALSLIHI